MADLDITTIAEALSRVQVNYSNLAQSWYNIFYNPTPMDVQLDFYDEAGAPHTYVIPNRAKDQKYIVNGKGSPEGFITAAVGSVYQDTQAGGMYLKVSGSSTTGWVKVISQADLENIIMRGSGEPEGKITAGVGVMYIREDLVTRGNNNKMGGYLYMKRTTSGNTGWERIDSYPSAFIREVFVAKRNETQAELIDLYNGDTLIRPATTGNIIILDGACENVDVLSIYVDGVMMAPGTYTLMNDLKTIELKEPLKIESTEHSLQIVAQYFIDVHVNESSVQQEIIELSKDIHNYLYGDVEEVKDAFGEVLPWDELPQEYKISIYRYWTLVKDKSIEITDQITKIDEYGDAVVEDIRKFAYGNITPTEEQLEKGILSVLQDYVTSVQTDWDEKYNEVYVMHDEVTRLSKITKEDIAEAKSWYNKNYDLNEQMQSNKDFIEREYEKGNIVLKTEPYTNLVDAPWWAHLQDQITANNTILTAEVNRIDTDLTQTIKDKELSMKNYVDAKDTELNNRVTVNRTAIANNNQALTDLTTRFDNADLSDFRNDKNPFYNKDNFPITKNGIFHLNKNVSVSDDATIGLVIEKDTEYYEVDLGEAMTKEDELGNFLGDTSFDLSITYNAETANMEGYASNMVTVIRVFLKNNTQYLPSINWDLSNISWLDSELKIEANRNYMLELISYDFMRSWYARAFVCQPPVVMDGILMTFAITCPAITDIEGFADKEVDVFYTVNNEENVYAGTYKFDAETKVLLVEQEFERKLEGTQVSDIAVRTKDMNIFSRYSNADVMAITEGAVYEVDCTEETVAEHTFKIIAKSTEIENYMIDNGLTNLTVDAMVTLASQEVTYNSLSYIYDAGDITKCGANVILDNSVLRREGANEIDKTTEDSVVMVKLRHAEMAEGSCYISILEEPIPVELDEMVSVHVEYEGTWV